MTTSLAQKKPTRKELFPRLSARCGVVVRLRVCPREGNPASVTSLLTLAAALGAPLSLNELVDLAGMADLADFADAGDDCLSFAGVAICQHIQIETFSRLRRRVFGGLFQSHKSL